VTPTDTASKSLYDWAPDGTFPPLGLYADYVKAELVLFYNSIVSASLSAITDAMSESL